MSAGNFGNVHQIIRIPSLRLTGTREAKLAELDAHLAQLQLVRLALCDPRVQLEGFHGARGNPHVVWGARAWPLVQLRRILARRTASPDARS